MNLYKDLFLSSALCALSGSLLAAVPAEWHYSQDIQVSAPGLQKVRLPVETLGAAQSSLADLRLFDAAGREIPFLIDSPVPEPSRRLPLERMTMTMEKKKTVITGAVPADMAAHGFEAITLYTPTEDFLKPVTLEASRDSRKWTTLLRQAPIFKQSGDNDSSTIRFPKGPWSFIRISLDDSETPPLRVAGVGLYALGHPIKDLVEFEPEILEVASDAHKTEVSLRLPADGLPIDSIRMEVPDTTFRRQMRLSSRVFSGGEFRENAIAQGSVYRITLGSQRTEELSVPVGQFVSGPFVTLTIDNGDSPPLTVSHLWMRSIPRDLIFDAPTGGMFQLYSGNPQAPARSYDLADLRGSFAKAAFKNTSVGPLQANPAYQLRQAEIPGVEEGSDIEADPWHFRKKVLMESSSTGQTLWRVELDPEAIAHNGEHLEALRLVRGEKQLPYIVDYAGVERSLPLTLTTSQKTESGKSQWLLELPYAEFPITQLQFTVPETLFQRTMTLYEMGDDESADASVPEYRTHRFVPDSLTDMVLSAFSRNESYPQQESVQGKPMRILGTATWTRLRVDGPARFTLLLTQTPKSNRLILETENGDNAPIHPAEIQAYYRAPRLLFRSSPNAAPVFLYYGQPEVAAPQYDLNLIATELLSTPPQEAHLGPEEALQASRWWEPPVLATGNMKHIFWGVMFLLVLGLLVVIAKLLPEEAESSR